MDCMIDSSLPREQEGDHIEWIRKYADNNFVTDNAAWAEAWFAVDALMHQTCHISATVRDLRASPGTASDSKIRLLLDELNHAHQDWQARKVIKDARERESFQRMNDIFMNMQIRETEPSIRAESSPHANQASKPRRILDYSPIQIHDPFVASRLNNWRAAQLHIRLIQDPMWGVYDGARFFCALDLCRTHAALEEERTFLGAEKAVGLYLAGVVFGGPDMYEVFHDFVVESDKVGGVGVGSKAVERVGIFLSNCKHTFPQFEAGLEAAGELLGGYSKGCGRAMGLIRPNNVTLKKDVHL